MKFIWYENLHSHFEETVKELSEFTGFLVSPDEMKVEIGSLNYVFLFADILYCIY